MNKSGFCLQSQETTTLRQSKRQWAQFLCFFLRSNCHLCPLIVNPKVQRFPFFLSSSELRRSEVNRKVNLKYRIVLPEMFSWIKETNENVTHYFFCTMFHCLLIKLAIYWILNQQTTEERSIDRDGLGGNITDVTERILWSNNQIPRYISFQMITKIELFVFSDFSVSKQPNQIYSFVM